MKTETFMLVIALLGFTAVCFAFNKHMDNHTWEKVATFFWGMITLLMAGFLLVVSFLPFLGIR